MKIYALTRKDVEWLGNAPAVAGGGVTAWDEADNGHPLPEMIRHVTGRPYLGTMSGIDFTRPLEDGDIDLILRKAKEELEDKKNNPYFQGDEDIYIHPLERRIRQIEEWLKA